MKLISVDVNLITPNPEQPRKAFDGDKLQELAASIKERGLIQPIKVQQGEGGYVLVDGERRWRAAKLAGLQELPALLEEATEPNDRLASALIANIQREDMNVVDEANAFARLRDDFEWSINKIHQATGASLPRIADRLELLKLDAEILTLFAEGRLYKSRRVIDALLSISDAEARVKIARALVQRNASVVAVENACRALAEKMAGKKGVAKGETPSIHYAEQKAGKRNVPAWDQLKKLGKLPSWEQVKESADKTCKACDWYESPSDSICGGCPAVQLIASMVAAK